MAYDNKSNLAYATVAIAPSPALSGTQLTVASGLGALFPTAPFNCVLYPPYNPTTGANRNPLAATAEIVRVTNRTGDVFTITRAQEGTTAKSITTGWQIANTASALAFTQIQDSIIQFISAGTTKASASEVVFSNSNNVSFGISGQTVTASIPAATQSTQPVAASASNGSFVFSTIGFSDANGVTFGTSGGSIITASVAAGVAAGSLSAGTSSMALGQVVFSDSNGVSFGLSNGNVTAQHNGLTSQSNQAVSASNGSFAFQTLGFSDANGVTFGTSGGSIITASVNAAGGGAAISAGTESQSTGTVVFSDSNGVSFGLDAGTLTASHNGLTSQSAQAASASNGSFAFQTIAFSNANNVTFGTSAGSIITASVNSGATGGGNGLQFVFTPIPWAGNGTSMVPAAFIQGYFNPFYLDSPISFNVVRNIQSFQGAGTSSAVSTTGQQGWTNWFGVYSRSVTDSGATNFSNSTNWVTVFSLSQTTIAGWSASGSSQSISYGYQTDSTGGSAAISTSTNANTPVSITSISGSRFGNHFCNTSLSAGEYLLFYNYSTSAAGPAAVASNLLYQTNLHFTVPNTVASMAGFGTGFAGPITNTTPVIPGNGYYIATLSSPPASIHLGQLLFTNNRQYFIFSRS